MIILNSPDLIFLHVPKTGGSTIHQALQPLLRPGDIEITHDKKKNLMRVRRMFNAGGILSKHSTLEELRGVIGDEAMGRFRTMSFVRNPFARALSAYRYILSRAQDGKVNHEGEPWAIGEMDFETFLDSPMAGEGGKPAGLPQVQWIPDPAAIDFLGRTETLTEDVQRFGAELGDPVAQIVSPEAKNVSGPSDAWKSMSTRAQDIIRSKYRDDFETFGYSTTIS